MSLTVSNVGSSRVFAPAPDGSHRAVCVGMYDLGTQEKKYQDDTQWKPIVLFIFELVDEKMDDGRPFTLSREFTISLHESSSLRPFLEAWRGRAFTEAELRKFDLGSVLGISGLASVIHKAGVDKLGRQKTYANLTSVTKLPRSMTVPEGTENELRRYEIESKEVPDWMPPWIAAKVRKSAEYASGGFCDPEAEAAGAAPAKAPAGKPPTHFDKVAEDDDDDPNGVPF